MPTLRNSIIAACATGVILALACCTGDGDAPTAGDDVTAEDVRREASEAAGTAGAFARSTVEEYKQEMRDAISAIDRDIEELRSRAESLTGDAKADAEDAIEDLRDQRDAFITRLNEASADSADAWREVRQGLDAAWADLSQAWQSARDQFDN